MENINKHFGKMNFFRHLIEVKRFIFRQLIKSNFSHLLTALIILFIFSPNLEVRDSATKSPLGVIIFALVLFTALRAVMQRGIVFWSLSGIIAINLTLNIILYCLPKDHTMIFALEVSNRVISIMFYFITVVHLSRYLFKIPKVTADIIKGGICAYMLIGSAWANIYGLLMMFNPNSFRATREMMYLHFSFTTLTTLGYGDIVPNTQFAAVVSNGEAIVGQLFLTIFVARLVGLHIAQEMNKDPKTI